MTLQINWNANFQAVNAGLMKNKRLNTFSVKNTHFLTSIPLKQVAGHQLKSLTWQISLFFEIVPVTRSLGKC